MALDNYTPDMAPIKMNHDGSALDKCVPDKMTPDKRVHDILASNKRPSDTMTPDTVVSDTLAPNKKKILKLTHKKRF